MLSQGFDDCSGIHACFRLLESFSGLLSRPIIEVDFEKKYFKLLIMMSDDLQVVGEIFQRHKDAPPIHYNMAPLTGSIAWVHELKDRISKAMEKLKSLNLHASNSEEANLVKARFADLFALLDAYESNVFSQWSSTIIEPSEGNLNKPLIFREQDLLKVNFDPKVVALLREGKYLHALNVPPPPTAENVFSRADVFRKYIFSLEHITGTYNGIRTGLLAVERPLVEAKIEEIDKQMERALHGLNWKSPDVDAYIQSISLSVGDLNSTLQTIKVRAHIRVFALHFSYYCCVERVPSTYILASHSHPPPRLPTLCTMDVNRTMWPKSKS